MGFPVVLVVIVGTNWASVPLVRDYHHPVTRWESSLLIVFSDRLIPGNWILGSNALWRKASKSFRSYLSQIWD